MKKLIVVLFFVVLISFTNYAYGATVPVGLLPFEVAINEDTKLAYVSHADATTSADQYVATLARWFGIPDENLNIVAPNIDNFALRDLGFLV